MNSSGVFGDVLEADEQMVWSGQPKQGVLIGFREIYALVLSVLGLGLLYKIARELTEADAWGFDFLSIMIVFLACGAVYLGFGHPILSAAIRRGKHFAVTDRRALALGTFPVRTLREKAIDRELTVRIHQIGSDGRGTLLVGSKDEFPVSFGGIQFWPSTFPQCLIFERIESAEQVAALIRRQVRERAYGGGAV